MQLWFRSRLLLLLQRSNPHPLSNRRIHRALGMPRFAFEKRGQRSRSCVPLKMSVPRFEKDDVSPEARLEVQRSDDSSQPGMPIYRRHFATPAPLSLLSFATSVFLASLTGVGTRGV